MGLHHCQNVVSINQCQQILNKDGKKRYDEKDVKAIRIVLYQLAEVEVSKFVSANSKINESNNVRKGFN